MSSLSNVAEKDPSITTFVDSDFHLFLLLKDPTYYYHIGNAKHALQDENVTDWNDCITSESQTCVVFVDKRILKEVRQVNS